MSPSWASVAAATDEEVAWLSSFLSFDDKEAQRAAAVARAQGKDVYGDGKHHLYQPGRRRFPSGLLGSVRREAERKGVRFDVVDERVPAPHQPRDASYLRAYQREALEACLARGQGVVKAPTGAGKTHLLAALVAAVPCRWIVAAPQIDLLDQTARRVLQLTGERCGKVGDGSFEPGRVTVATLQTLGERLSTPAGKALVRGAEGIIVDECHVLGASSFYRVVMAAENAHRRIGLSATPFSRGDGRSAYVMAALGPKIYEVPATELVAAGVLSKPTITMFPLRQHLPPRLGWQEVYRKAVVESEPRNRAVVALAAACERPCLVFVKEIDHGRVLLRMLQRAGISAGFVWGDTSTEDRQKAITKLSRGEVDVLVSSTIFEQGVDIQEVRTVVVASGGKSAIRAVQRLGRGMRVAEGKRAMQLWDFDDQGQVWLDRHSSDRMAAYLKEGHSVSKLDPLTAQLMLRKFQGAA